MPEASIDQLSPHPGHPLIDDLRSQLSSIQIVLTDRQPAVVELLSILPEWFRRLGTEDGIAAIEQRLGASVPAALRLFYRFPAIGCWLRIHHDTDIFLEAYSALELPAIVSWNQRPHLVLAEFPHSEVICAVELNQNFPQLLWGYDGEPKPFDYAPCYFNEWLSRLVDDVAEVGGPGPGT